MKSRENNYRAILIYLALLAIPIVLIALLSLYDRLYNYRTWVLMVQPSGPWTSMSIIFWLLSPSLFILQDKKIAR